MRQQKAMQWEAAWGDGRSAVRANRRTHRNFKKKKKQSRLYIYATVLLVSSLV
mgnify:CR=1 FL=1